MLDVLGRFTTTPEHATAIIASDDCLASHGIRAGDYLLVDTGRSDAVEGVIVVSIRPEDGGYCLRFVERRDDQLYLVADEQCGLEPIPAGEVAPVWAIVTHCVKLLDPAAKA